MEGNDVDPKSPYGMKSYKMAGDRATLEKLIPEETIAIEAGESTPYNRSVNSPTVRPVSRMMLLKVPFATSL
ncbi:MAG: hypothetical protein QOD75_987 [Blastocatellia bacterium]|jgi:hypothetical protein|nr:hypothetical protein [Blastocatellia bacterium]